MIGFMAQIPTVEWVYKENISRAQSCQFNGDKMVDKAHTFERKFWFNTLSPLCRHKVDIWLVENWIPLMDCDHLQTQYLSNATGLYNNPQW
jgi:hypothetical protein